MPSDQSQNPVRLDTTPDWDTFFSQVEDLSRSITADGLSLGVVQGRIICTYNLGFSGTVSAAFAQISAGADLPGPHVLRIRQPEYLHTTYETLARFPAARPIHEGSAYEAAACLLLPSPDGGPDLGYIALHYRGPHSFDATYRRRLAAVAAQVSDTLSQLLVSTDQIATVSQSVGSADPGVTLQVAMQRRALIDRARGVVMHRYDLDSAQALRLMAERSEQSGVGLQAIARAILSTIADDM